jgi:hypothetical protein
MKITWKTKTEQCLYKDIKNGDKVIIANNPNVVTKVEELTSGYLKIHLEAHTEYGIFKDLNIEGAGESIIVRILE